MVKSTNDFKDRIGPVQNKMQFEKVQSYFKDCVENGHEFLVGDQEPQKDSTGSGYFIKPTIIGNAPDDSRIVTEEPFGIESSPFLFYPQPNSRPGPIVPVLPWTSESDVIARANDTNTGLGACVWSSDIARARRIADEMDSGSVWVNSYEKPHGKAFMSGWKESGIGGEGGVQGLKGYCNTRVVHVMK